MTRVLVVGSDATPVATLREALRDAGADVTQVPDAAAALDDLGDAVYDCVIAGDLPAVDPERIEGHLREHGHAVPVVRLDDGAPERTATRAVERAEASRLAATRDRRGNARALLADLTAALRDCDDAPVIERTACDRLARSTLYRAAWIGRWEEARGVVVPSAAAGLEPDSLSEAPADPEGTIAGRVPVEWSPVVETDGPRAMVAVPVSGDRPLGVLQVYADRPEGIDDAERDVLEEIGAAVGAALARAEDDVSSEAGASLRVLGDTLAHELGNQLDAARVQLELARERDGGDHLERVEEALERIEDLAGDATALARGTVDAEALALPAAAEEAWAAVESSRATLSVEAGTIEADEDLLQLLLENLFRNAIEHGSTHSRPSTDGAGGRADEDLTVSVGPLADGFYVEDDGPGIPSEDREAVFEWGYTTRSSSGAGLGIVALIAERHGWSIELVEGEEGGARFEFRR